MQPTIVLYYAISISVLALTGSLMYLILETTRMIKAVRSLIQRTDDVVSTVQSVKFGFLGRLFSKIMPRKKEGG